MPTNIIVSLSQNTLKVSYNSKVGFQAFSKDLSGELVSHTKILDVTRFSEELGSLLSQFEKVKIKGSSVIFLVEPDDVHLSFITLSKQDSKDVPGALATSLKARLNGADMEQIYFEFQKIAPFVYQAVAMQKEHMDRYLEVAANLGLVVTGIVPWVLLLPKFLDSNDPCCFVFRNEDHEVVALSELNGIYHCESYKEDQSKETIQKLVRELAVYRREQPLQKIYKLKSDDVSFKDGFDVAPLLVLSDNYTNAVGYEEHLLVEQVLQLNPVYYQSNVNMLNALPLPAIVAPRVPTVYAGAAALMLVLLGGVGFFIFRQGADARVTTTQEVLSEATQQVVENGNLPPAQETIELSKEDLKIRVENGAGVAGVAAQTQEDLEALDYVVSEIGNAENTEYTTSQVLVKKSKEAYLDFIKEDFSKLFGPYETATDLDEESAYDLLVIVAQAP